MQAKRQKRLSWGRIVAIWWAKTWRYWVAIIGMFLVVVLALKGWSAEGTENIQKIFSPHAGLAIPILYFCFTIIAEMWALRESLVDRYRSFELDIEATRRDKES